MWPGPGPEPRLAATRRAERNPGYSVSEPGHRLPNCIFAVSFHPIEEDGDPVVEFLLPLLHLEALAQLI